MVEIIFGYKGCLITILIRNFSEILWLMHPYIKNDRKIIVSSLSIANNICFKAFSFNDASASKLECFYPVGFF